MDHQSTLDFCSLQNAVRFIPLTHGYFAMVDAADYAWLSQWKWRYDHGYAARSAVIAGRKRRISMHRLLLGTPDDLQGDHRNGIKLDNRRINLRNATRAENMQNRLSFRGSLSHYKGVYWAAEQQKWRVIISADRRRYHGGYFATEVEAAHHYDLMARELHGRFALLNFPEDV